MDRSGDQLNNSNMPTARLAFQNQPLPAYALYGEPSRQGLEDRLHVETVAQRSRLHDWEIKPHRHEALFQILVIRSGRVQAWLDGQEQALQGPVVVTVPAMAAHGFGFSTDVVGMVFTADQAHLWGLLGSAEPALRQALQALRALVGPQPQVWQAAEQLRAEFQGHERWRQVAIDTALLRLALAIARIAPGHATPQTDAPERAVAHVQRLQALVEAGFRQQPALSDLAMQIGITPTQLNRVCQRVLGHSALGVLHARVLLQAQRDLAYTGMSVKQVAHGLGFGDAGYFTRFFQRQTGLAPSAWRAARRDSRFHPGAPM